MKSTNRPSLLFGLLIAIVFFIGFFLLASGTESGYYLIYSGLGLGAIYWLWSVIEVVGTDDLKKYQKSFWLIIVIAVPFIGALMYHIIHRTSRQIAA